MSELHENEQVWNYLSQCPDGFFVEVGANDPQVLSQTWLLATRGWKGILVEPLTRLAEKLRAARPESRIFQVACAAPGHPATAQFFEAEDSALSRFIAEPAETGIKFVGQETVRLLTLDELLDEAGNPRIDFISIDVEGAQLDVLRGFTLMKHRPKLLLIEDYLTDWKTHFILRRQGYRLVKRTGHNSWYVPASATPPPTTFGERVRLWRKVWPGTPMRRLKFSWDRFRTSSSAHRK